MSNEELILILEKRFIKNENMHKGINWNDVLKRLNNEALFSIRYMEETGGEPDVIMYDKKMINMFIVILQLKHPLEEEVFVMI